MSICSLRGVEQRFTAQSAMGLAVMMAVCLSVSALARQATPPPVGTAEQTIPAPNDQSQAPGSAPLRVLVGKSLLINTKGDRIKRISVTDSAVADAIPISPTQILVHGRSAGEPSTGPGKKNLKPPIAAGGPALRCGIGSCSGHGRPAWRS